MQREKGREGEREREREREREGEGEGEGERERERERGINLFKSLLLERDLESFTSLLLLP